VTDEPLTEEHELWLRQFCTHDQKTAIGAGTTKPIPRDIYAKILSHAIRDEQDVITKSGILIQSQTGLRISEVLSLQENCLFKSRESGWQLCYLLGKTRRAEPVRHVLPAGELVVSAVQELMCATKALRQESGRTELFLLRNHGIRQVSETNWNRGRLRGFMMRWDIRDADGKIYELHSHQFRTTYVQRRLLAGDSIETLRQQLGHVSSEMTAQYAKLPQEELRMLLTHYMGKGEGD
jgi:integrase